MYISIIISNRISSLWSSITASSPCHQVKSSNDTNGVGCSYDVNGFAGNIYVEAIDFNPSSASIQLVELHLPSSSDLPPHYHTTNGLPSHLGRALRHALETAAPNFVNILENIKPDLLIYDFQPSWPVGIAFSLNIPAVYFVTAAASTTSLGFLKLKKPSEEFPFPEIRFPSNNQAQLSADVVRILGNIVSCMECST